MGEGSSRARRAGTVLVAAVLVVLSVAVWPSPAAGAALARRTFYVATDGTDAGPGTIDQPWRTIGFAIQRLAPGDRLYVRAGTYDERIKTPPIAAGRADARILVANHPGERPVIRGLLWLRNPSHWTISGINVTWSDANESDEHMVKMIDGTNWKLVDSEIWGARSFAAVLVVGSVPGQPSAWRISRNCIHDTYATNGTNQDQLVYVNTGVAPGSGTIDRNVLFNAPNGSGIKLGGPDPDDGGSAHVTVRYNTIYATSQNILVAWQSHSNTVTRNLLGLVGANYSNVRGYQLAGAGNVASDNAGYAARSFLLNDAGYRGVTDGGNAFAVDPRFDSTASCAGFHPTDRTASRYGRYAP